MTVRPITFALRCFARSLRWLPALLVLLVWMPLSFDGRAPTSTAALWVPALVVASMLNSIQMANMDSDTSREVLAAAIGGVARLHLAKAVAATGWGVATALGMWALLVAGTTDLAGEVAVRLLAGLWGAAVLGTALGSLLVRPVVERVAWQLLGAVILVMAATLNPLFLRLLDSLDQRRGAGGGIFLAVATIAAAAMVAAGGSLARRRS